MLRGSRAGSTLYSLRNSTPPPLLDLRVGGWGEDDVGDVGDDSLEGVAGLRGEAFPCRGVAEGGPFLIALGHVFAADHVGQVGQARTDQRVAVKDLEEASFVENFSL